ncbi:DNA-directed DNA polymerase [Candidatus Micrarchaeota archaeon]|nr:DNA-directed DNA polymerase [Candidatus Micrarchaeota archaeon]
MKTKGILLDIDSIQENEKSVVRLYVKTGKKIEIFKDTEFQPYFFAEVSDKKKAEQEIMEKEFIGKESKAKAVKIEEGKENSLKIYFNSTTDLVTARETIKEIPSVKEKREYDLIFTSRYLIDKGLEPLNGIELETEENRIISAKKTEIEKLDLNCFAFDFETFSGDKLSDPKKDPILMCAITYEEKNKKIKTEIITEKKGSNVVLVKDEKGIIEKLKNKIKESETDVLITYNGDSFDLPYAKERARKFGIRFDIGTDKSEPLIRRKGLYNATKIKGIQHLDAYALVRILARFGIISSIKYDLESVVFALYGKEKEKIQPEEINSIWKTGKDFERLLKYNLEDSEYTFKIAVDYMPLMVELGKLTKQTLFEVNRSSASDMVEKLLINKSFQEGKLFPNKPKEEEIKERNLKQLKGGFVREPIAGLHENIAVLDFRSLHPSIMISHNISPETVNCKCCEKGKNVSPEGDWFCEKKQGFLPAIQKELLEKRTEIKKELKKEKDEKKIIALNARQHAMKILLNSFYGYLAYERSRWYSFEAAKAVTSWSRHYIKEIASKAEKAGFTVIGGDTDSAFIKIPKEKSKENVKEFVEKINSELPGVMELELEGFFKRGIFVTKKEGTAAKKRYALIDEKDKLKIVGFEYVRRDWSGIAKNTQKKVIELILKEGKPKEAIKTVKKEIERLKQGKVPKKELIIFSQIKKSIAQYDSIGPHVSAAKKAIKKGKKIGVGSMIGYIITKTGKSISDKAEMEEFVAEGNYDAEYYIYHQLLPAVIKLIQELGYSEQDLIHGGKQSNLSAFG